MDRISSYNQQRTLISNALKVQAKLAEKQVEQSSGLKSQTYAGIASQARVTINLEGDMIRAERYVDVGEVVASRIDTMASVVTNIVDIANSARTMISQGMSEATSTTTDYETQLSALIENLQSQLNTKLDGRYLFSGGQTDTPPVDLTAYTSPTTATSGTVETSYYQGDDTVLTYKASDDLSISYGITANEEGFEKLFRSLSVAVSASSTSPRDAAGLKAAYQLVTEAVDGIVVIQSKVSNAATATEQAINANVDLQLYLENAVSDAKEVDLAAVTAEISAMEAQLQASYSTMTILTKMRLLDYL